MPKEVSKWDKFNESFDEDIRTVKAKSGPMKYISTDGFEKVSFYKPKKSANARDLNRIDILPFQISRKDYCKFRSEKGKVLSNKEIGDIEYKLEIPIHKRIGIDKMQDVVCLKKLLGKPCVICDENAKLYSEGKTDEAKAYYPSWRVFYNVIDLNEPNKGVQIWATTVFEVEADLQSLANLGQGKQIRYAHPVDGMEIHFFGKKRIFAGKESVQPTNFQFEPRDAVYDDDILLEAYPLDKMLILPTKEEVEQIFYGGGDEEEVEEETPVMSRRERKTVVPVEKIEEEESPSPIRRKKIVQQEEEEEEPTPIKKKKVVHEEEEEEEEVPVRKKKVVHEEVPTPIKRKKIVHEEEEQEDEAEVPVRKKKIVREEEEEPAPIKRKKIVHEEEEEVSQDNKKVYNKLEKDAEKTFNKGGKCPAGGNFGDDFNSLDKCDDCPQNTFDACGDKFDESSQ